MRYEITTKFQWIPTVKADYEATDCTISKDRVARWLWFKVVWKVYQRPRREDE